MLVLTVKLNELIRIGEAVIKVKKGNRKGQLRVVIDAPKSVIIRRIPVEDNNES